MLRSPLDAGRTCIGLLCALAIRLGQRLPTRRPSRRATSCTRRLALSSRAAVRRVARVARGREQPAREPGLLIGAVLHVPRLASAALRPPRSRSRRSPSRRAELPPGADATACAPAIRSRCSRDGLASHSTCSRPQTGSTRTTRSRLASCCACQLRERAASARPRTVRPPGQRTTSSRRETRSRPSRRGSASPSRRSRRQTG